VVRNGLVRTRIGLAEARPDARCRRCASTRATDGGARSALARRGEVRQQGAIPTSRRPERCRPTSAVALLIAVANGTTGQYKGEHPSLNVRLACQIEKASKHSYQRRQRSCTFAAGREARIDRCDYCVGESAQRTLRQFLSSESQYLTCAGSPTGCPVSEGGLARQFL